MNEKQFLKTMIETIKYDEDIQNKDDLLGILRYSIVTFRKTGAYTHVSNQRQGIYGFKSANSNAEKSKGI